MVTCQSGHTFLSGGNRVTMVTCQSGHTFLSGDNRATMVTCQSGHTFLSGGNMVSLDCVTSSCKSLSIQRHQYHACLSECQVSLHSETSVSRLSVRVPGLSPFRNISIKPICQSGLRHIILQVSLHSETLVSRLSVRVPGLSPFRDISITPVSQSARSLSIQRHQYHQYQCCSSTTAQHLTP
uniref:Uncharacterized protein n=1 Tax=Hucho hucho TaxID=62062 RepID=A0A4W5JX87_9TELE